MIPHPEGRDVRHAAEAFAVSTGPLTVERFEPASAEALPVVLLLHGADGVSPRAALYHDLARRVAAAGFLVLFPHYLGDPHARFEPLRFLVCANALEEVAGLGLKLPRAAGERVGAVGLSLGGYLALTLAARGGRVAAVVECSGGLPPPFVADFDRLPPVLILHGEADLVVPVSEAHRLAQKLRERGLPHELHTYPGQGHELRGAALDDALGRAVDFLGQYLPAPGRLRPAS